MNTEEKAKLEIAKLAEDLMADWSSSRNQQKQFVLNYVENNFTNATDACRRAGYAEKSSDRQASRMLRNDEFSHIQEVVRKLQSAFEERATDLSIAEPIEVRQFLTRVMRGEETEERIINGQVREVKPSLSDRSRSAELLGKAYGMWTEKHEISGDLNISEHAEKYKKYLMSDENDT